MKHIFASLAFFPLIASLAYAGPTPIAIDCDWVGGPQLVMNMDFTTTSVTDPGSGVLNFAIGDQTSVTKGSVDITTKVITENSIFSSSYNGQWLLLTIPASQTRDNADISLAVAIPGSLNYSVGGGLSGTIYSDISQMKALPSNMLVSGQPVNNDILSNADCRPHCYPPYYDKNGKPICNTTSMIDKK